MSEIRATRPAEFVFRGIHHLQPVEATDPVALIPYPGWRFVPAPDGWRHEKIPETAAGEGEHWVDIAPSQLRAIRNDHIEECAAALEQEASHNERVAQDKRDSLETRARAERVANVKRSCACVLRGMKK